MVSWEDVRVFLSRLNAQGASNIPEGWAYVLGPPKLSSGSMPVGPGYDHGVLSWGDSISTPVDANYHWDEAVEYVY